jgi:L-fuculose-phosphate aldolase
MPDTARDRRTNQDPAALKLKTEMMYGYHMLGRHGLGLGLLGHLTARTPKGDTFYSYPLGVSFDEVTLEDIYECDYECNVLDGDRKINPTMRIHGIIYEHRPDVMAISHHHGDYCMALGAIGEVIKPYERTACRFHDDMALIEDYDNVHRVPEQGEVMMKALGKKMSLMLKHHGVLVAGRNVPHTVVSIMEAERSARVQLMAMAAGKLQLMESQEEIKGAHHFNNSDQAILGIWDYECRCLRREKAEYFA